MRWRVDFYDKHGDETRSLTVTADNEEAAECAAEAEADKRRWRRSFKIAEAVPLDTGVDAAQGCVA